MANHTKADAAWGGLMSALVKFVGQSEPARSHLKHNTETRF
jgi:hypothetical protein